MANAIRKCSIDGCEKGEPIVRGWCKRHYRRWQRHGDPLAGGSYKSKPSSPFCTIDGCKGKHFGRGWCNKHYQRWQKYGDPLHDVNRQFSDPEESFAYRTKRSGECLLWTGATSSHGYGKLWVKGEYIWAHRYAWQRVNGEIPAGLEIDHICHVRNCVEISHIRTVTPSQNKRNLSGARRTSVTGVRNVFPSPYGWRVGFSKNGNSYHFGYYSTIQEAVDVAEAAREELFGEFAGKG